MSRPTFNLTTERWIPCIQANGETVECGLEEALVRAHELREIWDDSPLVTFSLYRLLLALIYRTHPAASSDDWAALWEKKRFDQEVLSGYFEKWCNRFDLYDEEHPFWQSMDDILMEAPPKSISILGHQYSAGNNAVLFDHTYDVRDMALAHSQAARLLVATQMFAVGGGVSSPCNFTSGPCVPGAMFLVRGENLFQTLLLNLVARHGLKRNTGADVPLWERDTMPTPSPTERVPLGILDYLTWRSRRVLLLPKQDGCSLAKYQQGDRLSHEVWDPAKIMRKGKTDFLPLRFLTDRVLWRDSHTFYADHSEQEWYAPKVVTHLAELKRNLPNLCLPTRPMVEVYGLANDQAKVISWHRESYPLPEALLEDRKKAAFVRELTESAETICGLLGKALWRLAADVIAPSQERSPDPNAVKAMISSFPAERNYWSALNSPFQSAILDLPKDPEDTVECWKTLLKTTARGALAQTINGLGGSPRALKGSVEAERLLGKLLNKII